MLAGELNLLGCSRTVEEWQHIWSVWVIKTKGRARKARDSISGTGGGPAGPDLTETEKKILEIVGSASVYGFGDLEVGIPGPPLPDMLPVPPPSSPPTSRSPIGSPHRAGSSNEHRRRRRLPRPTRPLLNDSLAEVLRENGRLMADSIIRGAEIIAAAITALGIPIEIEHHNDQ